jgi:hypothetical protein
MKCAAVRPRNAVKLKNPLRGAASPGEIPAHWQGRRTSPIFGLTLRKGMAMDDRTRTELEAAVYRRLVEHLRTRSDVQNIDLMNLAGFCRNCLSNWMKEAADAKGLPMSKEESREIVYGEPYAQWQAKHQKEASPEQKKTFEQVSRHKH